MVLAQYYNFVRYGHAGYRYIMETMQANTAPLPSGSTRWARSASSATGAEQLPLVAFQLAERARYDEFDIASQLAAERGWMVPAYTLPPNAEHVTIMRALVKLTLGHTLASTLADDIAAACETLDNKGGLHADRPQAGEDRHGLLTGARQGAAPPPRRRAPPVTSPACPLARPRRPRNAGGVSAASDLRLPSAVAGRRPRRPAAALRRGTVRRDRLVRTLLQSTDAPFVVVRAPAGYGKTTLLCQWAERDDRPFAWIAPGARALERAPWPRRVAVAAVAVVDGADVEAGPVELAAWTRELPAGSQLAIATRSEPSLPLGTLRAQGLVVELGAAELAMTRREATAMLSMAGVELEPADVATLLQRTEGWPAALHRRRALDPGPDRSPHGGRRLRGRRPADGRLPARRDPGAGSPARRRVPAADLRPLAAVGPGLRPAGRHGRLGTMLRELSRAGIPLVPLDRTDDEFRHHPLLADDAPGRAAPARSARTADLHRRAAAWHEREGRLDEASATRSPPATTATWLRGCGRSPPPHRPRPRPQHPGWLARMSPEQVAAHAPLALTAAATISSTATATASSTGSAAPSG
jgi:hypothetical protein